MGFGLELFNTSISHRVAFIEAMIAGLSVLEYAPGSTAAKEIRRLLDEII
jgi:cellulose biosynthesis protein BcsQ